MTTTAGRPENPAAVPADKPDYSLPRDGKIDLGNEDYVTFAMQPSTGSFMRVTDAFERLRESTLEESIRAAEQKARALKARVSPKAIALVENESSKPMFEFALDAIEALAVDACVRCGTDLVRETNREALLRWPLAKTLIAGRYAIALRERFGSAGL